MAFASRVLTPAECRHSTTNREALAVIQAIEWFRPYIWGTQFVLRTDHASLQWLFRQNNDGMIFRMLQRLQEFNFQVVHRPGDKHGSTDGLSRQCSITPELTDAERLVMFGSCPSANSLEYALGRINLVAAEDANELMSIQFQEDVNSLRLAVSSTKYRCKEKNSPSPEKENQCWEPIQQSGSRYPGTCYPQRQAVQNTYSY